MSAQLQKHKTGHYFVGTRVSYRDAVVRFIGSQQFLYTEGYDGIDITNRRNQLFRIEIDGAPRPLMMKINWINPALSLRKRVSTYLNARLKNYPRRGYEGAVALNRAGVPGVRPVAYWHSQPRSMQEKGYFLYEEIDAECSVARYQLFATRETGEIQQRVFNELIRHVVILTRNLHDANLRHGSVELGNFLVRFGCIMEDATVTHAANASLFLIDTDRMTKTQIRTSLIKRIFDMRDLCRINVDRQGREYFLRCYLQEDYSGFWQRVLEFWNFIHVGRKRKTREEHPALAQPRP